MGALCFICNYLPWFRVQVYWLLLAYFVTFLCIHFFSFKFFRFLLWAEYPSLERICKKSRSNANSGENVWKKLQFHRTKYHFTGYCYSKPERINKIWFVILLWLPLHEKSSSELNCSVYCSINLVENYFTLIIFLKT